MPAWLGVDAALDISPLSGELLKKEGWGGDFKVGSAEKIPWPDKSFELAVCSEVVEHMANIEEVRRTLAELRRVARTWLVTTPCASVWGVRDVWNTEPTHKLFFDLKTLSDLSEATEKHSWIIFEGRKIDSVKHAFLWGIR
jgi:ubiquinone/menaquinone biosynthesis C-methylase UbiE